MSISFPIKYNAEDSNNSVMTKYYQLEKENENENSNIQLEKDICLRHMLQQNSAQLTYNATDVVYETVSFATNLSIEDPNCSISNPTAFCIAAKYVQYDILEQDPLNPNSHTVVIGTNNFAGIANTISTQIKLATDNSPIFDTNLLITISNNNESFYSLDENRTIIATFDINDSDILLSKAINSAYNIPETPETPETDNLSLLTFGEDTNFNNEYALGKLQNKYFTKDLTTYKLDPVSIADNNVALENNVSIEIDPEKIGQNSFGTFKIKIEEAKIVETFTQGSEIQTTFLIGDSENNNNDNNISDASQLSKYLELFNDISSGNSFEILVTDKKENSGINFANNNDDEYFTINNSEMSSNINFMEKIISKNMALNVVLTQEPMTIVLESCKVNNEVIELTEVQKVEADANIVSFELTKVGEKLGVNDYNKDGEIILQIAPENDRIEVEDGNQFVYNEVIVDYGNLDIELKTTKNVYYGIYNIITPTGAGYYNPVTTHESTNTSFFINGETAPVTIVSSNIVNEGDEITLIKINPSSTLTNNIGGNILYELNDSESGIDVPINAKIIVDISDNIDIFKEKYDLRYKLYPKTINELGISSVGDSEGKNKIEVLTGTLPITNDSNTWKLGYKNEGESFVKTDINTFASSANYFPSASACRNVINNSSSLDIKVTYDTETETTIIFFDKVTILCNDIEYTVPQGDIKFITKPEEKKTFFNRLEDITIDGENYKVVKETNIEVYNSTIDFKLAGTTNLSLMTPLLKSTITKY